MDSEISRLVEAIKAQLKTGDLWERLNTYKNLRLPSTKAHFLRSVENMKSERGPFTNFRLLKVILKEMNWSADRLFGLESDNQGEPSGNARKDEKAEPAKAPDPVIPAVERALAMMSAQLEVKAVKSLTRREKREPADRVRIFKELQDRTMHVLSLSTFQGAPSAEFLLYTKLTKPRFRFFGHLGPDFSLVDSLLTPQIQRRNDGTADVKPGCEWKLLVAYQLTAIRVLLKPLMPPSTEALMQFNGAQTQRAVFNELMASVESLWRNLALPGYLPDGVLENRVDDLQIAAVALQNAMTMITESLVIRDAPTPIRLTRQQQTRLAVGADLMATGKRPQVVVLNFGEVWAESISQAIKVLHSPGAVPGNKSTKVSNLRTVSWQYGVIRSTYLPNPLSRLVPSATALDKKLLFEALMGVPLPPNLAIAPKLGSQEPSSEHIPDQSRTFQTDDLTMPNDETARNITAMGMSALWKMHTPPIGEVDDAVPWTKDEGKFLSTRNTPVWTPLGEEPPMSTKELRSALKKERSRQADDRKGPSAEEQDYSPGQGPEE